MKTITLFITLAYLVFTSELPEIPDNSTIKFGLLRASEPTRNGLIMATGKQFVILELETSSLDKQDIDSLISLFDSPKYDFSANLILYSYFKREALPLTGIGTYSDPESRDLDIAIWRDMQKENDRKYWVELRDSLKN